MIFKQWLEIFMLLKTETRRLFDNNLEFIFDEDGYTILEARYKPNEKYPQGRKKIAVGDIINVIPARAHSTIHFRPTVHETSDMADFAHESTIYDDMSWLEWSKQQAKALGKPKTYNAVLQNKGWKPLQVKVQTINIEKVREISYSASLAEGVGRQSIDGFETFRDYSIKNPTFCLASPIASYKTLWDSINPKAKWETNPSCLAYQFIRPEFEHAS